MGLTGLGAEICKNIVLCGVKSLTLLDDEEVTMQDFTAQFLIPRMDLGKNVRTLHHKGCETSVAIGHALQNESRIYIRFQNRRTLQTLQHSRH